MVYYNDVKLRQAYQLIAEEDSVFSEGRLRQRQLHQQLTNNLFPSLYNLQLFRCIHHLKQNLVLLGLHQNQYPKQ